MESLNSDLNDSLSRNESFNESLNSDLNESFSLNESLNRKSDLNEEIKNEEAKKTEIIPILALAPVIISGIAALASVGGVVVDAVKKNN